MRFPQTFRRQKGSVSSDPALGSDAVPTTSPPLANQDNVLSCKLRDVNGWPVQRVAVCWTTTATSPTPLNANLYFWEDATQHWYLINATALSLLPNQLYFFDTATISEPTPTAATLAKAGSPAQAGAMSVYLQLIDPGSQVNGVFVVAMGGDLTTVGT